MHGWASVKKAAKYTDVSERTMRSWMKDGLRYSRLPSGMIRIRYSALDEFIEAYEAGDGRDVDRIVDEIVNDMVGNRRN